jgi:N,N'-diacetylchitobiose phosphorylase
MMRSIAGATGAPAYLLGNGRYAVLLTRAGAGYSACAGHALTRWTPDPVRQTQGFFFYVREVETNACWCAGFEPLARLAARYGVYHEGARVELVRADEDIETRLEVCVAADADAELRRLTFTNASARPRLLEVTSYLEVVLADLRSDAAHPAFSRLFVQTAWLPQTESLLAWRRPRAPDDTTLTLVHRLIGGERDVSFETDRARFLGRGRSPAEPRALDRDACLTGTVGSVLDPVLSLRRTIRVAPNAATSLVAILGAAPSRAAAETLLDRYSNSVAESALHRSCTSFAMPLPGGNELSGAAARNRAALGLPVRWIDAAYAVPVPAPVERAVSFRPAGSGTPAADAELWRPDEELRCFNGFGGFSTDGTEYVIRMEAEPAGPRRPPVPWTNVVANERAGFLATESGAGYTWYGNSRRHRLTPWSNDPVSDPPGEAFYLRDDDAGEFWSLTPAPSPGAGPYEVRHGFGYTRYRHRGGAIDQDVCMFVPRDDPVKIALIALHNLTDGPRRLTLHAFFRWVLGAKAQDTARDIVTRHDAARHAIFADNRKGFVPGSVAFAAVAGVAASDVRVTADRAAFLGTFGTLAAPVGVTSGAPLDGRTGAELDPCAAFEVPVALEPHGTVSLAVLLGAADGDAAARALLDRYAETAAAEQALAEVRAFWHEQTGGIHVTTPAPAIDLMVNGWLAYQTLSCRLWARSAFYQSGGAFGFRDQLQDAAALLYLDPALTRAQILLHAGHQFREGDVLHWWHPPDNLGIRTRFSDDLLWLPYITSFYVRATGDDAVLAESAPFLRGRALEPGEDETPLVPEAAGEADSIYEHCCRALDRSLTRGAHGLPLIGAGDWNDGMNRVGREGRGESVWLGFFLCDILDDFIPLCDERSDVQRAARYRDYRAELARALEDAGWDGAWYRRAYYDDGSPIGSAQSDECRIDAIAQAWAVLSGVAPAERATLALDALEQQLVDEHNGLIRLLAPPFDRTPHDPGYIKGYVPGVRENGGQYTHGALWAVRALAENGRIDRAAQLLEMLSPVSHGSTREQVDVYRAEPFVIAADVYGEPPHAGRAGWSWYTGSAGWMLRVALESVLGFALDRGRALRLRPRIPETWPGYQIRYRVPGARTRYDIDVRRDANTLLAARLDDSTELEVEGDVIVIPLGDDGALHSVSVLVPRR